MTTKNMTDEELFVLYAKRTVLGVILASVALIFFTAIYKGIRIVEPGFEGVAVKLGKAQSESLSEGMHLVTPFITVVHPVDCRIQRVESASFEAASKDLQSVKAQIVVNYNLRKESVVALYRDIGLEYANVVITPGIQEVYKATTALFSAEELITQRQKVSEQIRETLSGRLEPYGIIITQVNVVNFDFSAEFNSAIEKKVQAEQEALRAENELKRIKIEAQQAEEKAKGEANALLAKADAEAQSLRLRGEAVTPMVVLLDMLQQWDGKMPQTLLVGGNSKDITPIFDVSK